ncbi:hypothetical protein CMI38_03860 [Candidatus Pacearchaeota archaeon]|jgi:hypothetical protein|nr:hypothetical protein [Candidatus Pacearchaeota archaeon]|tara:strand:+ start:2931 stop:3236 length:306 start_codon:yes stop_codon:yes gene_type:complete
MIKNIISDFIVPYIMTPLRSEREPAPEIVSLYTQQKKNFNPVVKSEEGLSQLPFWDRSKFIIGDRTIIKTSNGSSYERSPDQLDKVNGTLHRFQEYILRGK